MNLQEFKKKEMRNPKFRAEYNRYDLAFEVSQMLIEARIVKGITQEKLANLIKTKQTSIARAESGRSLPTLSFLQKIAYALNTYLLAPRLAFLTQQEIRINTKSAPVLREDKAMLAQEYGVAKLPCVVRIEPNTYSPSKNNDFNYDWERRSLYA